MRRCASTRSVMSCVTPSIVMMRPLPSRDRDRLFENLAKSGVWSIDAVGQLVGGTFEEQRLASSADGGAITFADHVEEPLGRRRAGQLPVATEDLLQFVGP
jgi:hypothetical protein